MYSLLIIVAQIVITVVKYFLLFIYHIIYLHFLYISLYRYFKNILNV